MIIKPIKTKIDKFEKQYEALSNFADSMICYEYVFYPTVEHYFQAMKTLDPKERGWIASAPTPGEAKRRGRSVKLRPDWEEVKEQVMLDGLRLKFKIPAMREVLLSTQSAELIEGNWWHDNTWGDCYCDKCKDIEGKNMLGKLLMKVRSELY
jgi:ribA/ribD-fused uncharacterized protein